MTRRREVTVSFTRDQIEALDTAVAVAIAQWPAHMLDVDDRLLELSRKIGAARNEMDR